MKPVLCHIGIFTVYSYGFFVALAFFIATFLVTRQARRVNLNENLVYNLCIILLVSGIVSARIFYIFLNLDFFTQNPLEIIMLQHGGLVWFGGLTGASICGVLFLKLKRLPFFKVLDLFSPYAALGQSIGRIGCFFNGCCFGRPDFHFPSQLIDSFTLFLIFIVLKFLPRGWREGRVFVLYLALASFQRFLMEFIRGDERPFYLSLSIFQWISLGIFTIALVIFLFLYGNKKTDNRSR